MECCAKHLLFPLFCFSNDDVEAENIKKLNEIVTFYMLPTYAH